MTPSLKTGIIGAGRIASEFGTPSDKLPLTLAHAIQLTNGLSLGGFFDTSPEASLASELKWNCQASPRDFESWLAEDWDIICIASPDAFHASHLTSLLSRSPSLKAILAEKPLCTDLSAAESLFELAATQGTPLQVNYPRRWHPKLQQISDQVLKGKFGKLRRFQICCSGGLLHNGSHAVDILASWIPLEHLTNVKYTATSPSQGTLRFTSSTQEIEILLIDSVQIDCYLWEIVADFDLARISLSGVPEHLSVAIKQEHPDFCGFNALITNEHINLETEPLLLHSIQHLVSLTKDKKSARHHLSLETTHHKLLEAIFSQHPNA